MKVINTYSEIIALCDNLQDKFELGAWRKYATGISAALPKMLEDEIADYDFDSQVLPVLNAAIGDRAALEQTNASFSKVTDGLPKHFKRIFQTDMDVDIILYLGLCNGAGWATMLDGRMTVLLGIEKIIELEWFAGKAMTGLVYHELGHILHLYHGHRQALHVANEKLEGSDKWLWQLYQEGIAMYAEQLLGGDANAYHQDIDGWAAWCSTNKNDALKEFKRRLHENESCQDFFGDWCSWRGQSNVGYYLGCEVVKEFAKQYSFAELLDMEFAKIKEEFDIV